MSKFGNQKTRKRNVTKKEKESYVDEYGALEDCHNYLHLVRKESRQWLTIKSFIVQ